MIKSLAPLFALAALCGMASAAAPIETLAGTGAPGYSGDGGPAAEAQINNPYGLTIGPDGALYVCEIGNHVIRRIAPDGTISTAAGCGQKGYAGDGGPATQAKLNEPYEVRFDAAGNMVFVEMQNHLIRRVDAKTGAISTLAGTGEAGFAGDGGPAAAARFNRPHSIQFGPDGTLYVCDIGNHRLRAIDPKSGEIRTVCGNGKPGPTKDGDKISPDTPLKGPRAADFDADGRLWLALREGNAVFALDFKSGRLKHIAGTGKSGFTGNGGPARDATLSGPKGIAAAPDGDIYLADTESHSVRRIDVSRKRLELVAGDGKKGDGPDGDPLKCRMARPHGVFVSQDGTLYIGDSEAHRVRVIRPEK